ncbi:hypothetical protein O9929_26070 [Vibrio lentus]|nr:hypothetical protein [Vibrio lentus]
MDVIIEDNIIKQIGEDLAALPNMTIINGEGKTRLPDSSTTIGINARIPL